MQVLAAIQILRPAALYGMLCPTAKKLSRWREMPWDKVVEKVEKAVFRVYAGDSAGTCFAFSIGAAGSGDCYLTAFATAWHVLADLPGTPGLLRLVSADRTISVSDTSANIGFSRIGPEEFDTGLIFVRTSSPILTQENLLPSLPFGFRLAKGAEIGWLGFPGLVEPESCFFKGVVSGYLNEPPTYLVDGVALNGVSGGPAFDNRAHVIGLVSSYIPNTLGNVTLPGILTLMPISAVQWYFQEVVKARVI